MCDGLRRWCRRSKIPMDRISGKHNEVREEGVMLNPTDVIYDEQCRHHATTLVLH